MIAVDIISDGTKTRSGPDFDPKKATHVTGMVTIMGMPNGTKEGNPTVIFRIPVPGQQDIFFETSLRVFCTAADALKGYYESQHGWKP